jgi:hypothetical protein
MLTATEKVVADLILSDVAGLTPLAGFMVRCR